MQQFLSDLTALSKQIAENQTAATTLRAAFSDHKELFLNNLQKAGFPSPESLESIRLSPEERNRLRNKKEELSHQKSSLDTNYKNIGDELQSLTQQDDLNISLTQVLDDLRALEEAISGQLTKKGSIGPLS